MQRAAEANMRGEHEETATLLHQALDLLAIHKGHAAQQGLMERLAIERREGGNADVWVIDLSRGTTARDADRPRVGIPDAKRRLALTARGTVFLVFF